MRLEYGFELSKVDIPRFSVEAVEGIGKLFTLATLVLNVLDTRPRAEIVFHGLNPDDPAAKIEAFKEIIGSASTGSRLKYTPVGAIYFLRRFFPNTPLWLLILYVALVVAGIAILAFIVAKIFGRGARKRSKKMANDLASDSTAGPSKVDASAAIKANNEKFFKAVRDMRKEARISVYDLPWYVVIGDSGCGKTFLVNNGGLTFSLGKPEGYQLGTLNYNWWFTEDAVFVDMAGRLCNPQDDGDRREWEAFLNTIAKGRRGFPINGTILCISMEHLLEDAPEKHESDAVIALERLRDLQSKAGRLVAGTNRRADGPFRRSNYWPIETRHAKPS